MTLSDLNKYPPHLGSHRTPIPDVQSVHLVLALSYALQSASTPQGARPVPLFVSFHPRGTSDGPASDDPLPPPPPPLLLLPPPPMPLLPLPLTPEPPPLPPLLQTPPPPPLRASPVLLLTSAFLARASLAAVTLASTPPSADPPPVTPRRLVPFPTAREEPTCVNTPVAPNRHLPLFSHCRHSPYRAPAATLEATVGWWTSALTRPPLHIYARMRG